MMFSMHPMITIQQRAEQFLRACIAVPGFRILHG